MHGTITLDLMQDGRIILNARRNSPYAHRRRIFDKGQVGIHSFISHYIEAVADPAIRWDTD